MTGRGSPESLSAKLDGVLAGAVDAGAVPYVVAVVARGDGTIYAGASGEAKPGKPADPDTVFRIFSMTKAIGSLATMLLIDRGKLTIDTPVADVIPEFSEIRLLRGFDKGHAVLVQPRETVTVRHLATHTSGLVYAPWSEEMTRYVELTNHPDAMTGRRRFLFGPQCFEAGEKWGYGIGIDWLGQIIERIDGRRIDTFCRQEIFQPLGMHDTTFEAEPQVASRLGDVYQRQGNAFSRIELAPPADPEVYGMGHALYSTAPDYTRFLRLFLNNGSLERQRICSGDAVSAMLANQIGTVHVPRLPSLKPELSADLEYFPGVPKTHSFGFLRFESDVPAMRARGSLAWSGVANTHFWLDPESDVSGVFMTQTLPFLDPRVMQSFEAFERNVYSALRR